MFECELDGPGAAIGEFAPCASPKSYTQLADGTYTFSVRAVDNGLVDLSPERRTFTVARLSSGGGGGSPPPAGGGGPQPGGTVGGAGGTVSPPGTTITVSRNGPTLSFHKGDKTLRVTLGGTFSFVLGPFTEAVSGDVTFTVIIARASAAKTIKLPLGTK
jgi:hypothetical protein